MRIRLRACKHISATVDVELKVDDTLHAKTCSQPYIDILLKSEQDNITIRGLNSMTSLQVQNLLNMIESRGYNTNISEDMDSVHIQRRHKDDEGFFS